VCFLWRGDEGKYCLQDPQIEINKTLTNTRIGWDEFGFGDGNGKEPPKSECAVS
jgi:hypothetical protein